MEDADQDALAAFLLARIAEDEALVRRDVDDGLIARTWAQWVLADCAARRRVVEQWQGLKRNSDDGLLGARGAALTIGAFCAVSLLAEAYDTHVDYLEHWRFGYVGDDADGVPPGQHGPTADYGEG